MRLKLLFSLLSVLIASQGLSAIQDRVYAVRGRVSDENGQPLPGAAITVLTNMSGTYSGSDGTYEVRLKEGGTFRLRFSYTGYDPEIRSIEVDGPELLDVSLTPRLVMAGEVIVSATRAGDRTPVAFYNITPEKIRSQNNGRDLPFLISLTPSLVETSEAGTGIGYTGMRIRGTDGSRINVTIDGIPLNDAESQQVFWVDLPDLASSVENIQVQRGIGTSTNGAAAFGATINLQTRNPERAPYATISSTAGSFATFRNMAGAGTGLMSERFAFQVRYSDIRSNGYIRRTGSENRAAHLTGVYLNDKSMVKANIILGEEHTGIGWWGVPAEMLEKDRRYNPAGEYTDEDGNLIYYENESDNYVQTHYQLILNHSFTDNTSFHTALHYTKGKGYYEEFREDQAYARYGLQDIYLPGDTISQTDLVRRKWMSNDFYGMVWSLKTRKGKFDAAAGGGMNRYDGDHFGRIIWMKYAGNTANDHQWYLNTGVKNEVSAYGKVNYRFSDRLNGFADIQYRYISYRMNGPDDDLKDISQSHFFHFFNPKAGLFLTFTERMSAYISLAAAGREPTRSDFKEAAGDPDATPRPETLYDLEAGYNLRLDKTDIGINLYGMFYKDQLIPTGELSNVGYPVMTNAERSYRAGIEVTAEIRPWSYLKWNVSATLSRNRIPGFSAYYVDYNTSDWSSQYKSIQLGTVDIAYSPSLTGYSDLAIMLPAKMELHLISKYVGRQYFDNTMSRDRMIDPYSVTSLLIQARPELKRIKQLDIKLFVNNLFNSLYESNAYGGMWYEDGVEKTWSYYFPQAGINFLAGVDIKF